MARIRFEVKYVLELEGDSIPHVNINDLIMEGAIVSIPGVQAIEGNARLAMTNLSLCRARRKAVSPASPPRPRKPKLKLV